MLLQLAESESFYDEIAKLTAVSGGILVLIIYVVFGNWRKAVKVREREETRRELAAYVAEGTISADDAARLIGADADNQEERIKRAMADGWLSPKKAEEMLEVVRKSQNA